jgi:hypothetical protein
LKKFIAALVFGALMLVTAVGYAQDEGQWLQRYIRTTADTAIDSLTVPNGKRVFIKSVWAWYDNAANTNTYNIEIVSGKSAIAQQGTIGRIFKWGEAMTSGGRLALTIPEFIGVTSDADSTVYFSIGAASSDTLIACYTYKYISR